MNTIEQGGVNAPSGSHPTNHAAMPALLCRDVREGRVRGVRDIASAYRVPLATAIAWRAELLAHHMDRREWRRGLAHAHRARYVGHYVSLQMLIAYRLAEDAKLDASGEAATSTAH